MSNIPGNTGEDPVVITGMGVATPLGNKLEEFTDSLLAGKSAGRTIDLFDVSSMPVRIAAMVDDSDIAVRYTDRKISFAMHAAMNAWKDAGLDTKTHQAASAVVLGTGLELFNMPDMLDYLAREKRKKEKGEKETAKKNSPGLDYLQTPSDIAVHLVSNHLKLDLPPRVLVSACAAATDAIGIAYRMLQSGRADRVIAGGTDSMINPLGLAGFCRLQALSARNDCPEKASRPFDANRDGFLMGEGAGLLVLERRSDAVKRKARIYAEVAGYGNSFDAHGISEPHPQGDGAVLAMQRAMADARIDPEDIDYINAHGTGTPKNDVVETHAIRRVFGKRADSIPVSSTKSMIGHLISASGAVELVASILCAGRGYVHPTINLDTPDSACDLDYVAGSKRPFNGGWILKNSFAFGGQNASLVLRVPVN